MKKWKTETIQIVNLAQMLDEWSADGWEIHSIVNANPADLDQDGDGDHNGWVYVVAFKNH